MTEPAPRSDWNYPTPRPGLAGELDRFIGPGANRAEILLQLFPSVLARAAAVLYAIFKQPGWHVAQITLAALLAFDLMGGIITNATAPAKRWYHRAGQGFGQHVLFVAVHVLHIGLVAWLFRARDWTFFGVASLYLLGAAWIILRAPLYLQRPIAMLLYALSLLMSFYLLAPTPGLEWFLPFFFLKLLVSHLIREEPYRPS